MVNNLGNGKLCCVSTFLDDDDNPFIEGELILYPKKAKQLKITERTLVDTQIPEHADMFKKFTKMSILLFQLKSKIQKNLR